MVAAQWGETRDTGARTGGGASGRFRLLGGAGTTAGEVPDTTPPTFGTAPWGYRKSEVDAWATWVAGLVAHGRNETVRADSAEATLRATLERLEQLERPGATAPSVPDAVDPLPARHPDGSGNGSTAAPTGSRTGGRLHVETPTDLPRRRARGTSAGADATSGADTASGAGTADVDGTDATGPTRADVGQGDHELARLHVVETTLHEVMGLLHHLADRKADPNAR
ncbi:hypothetical protein [Pseudonocardia endophytica]|uniref:Uncharacterized protein n=1 Tax=Pseudonocardia endophytica TaxID=401976 RepID=A0A4R1HZ43_PSEEN|nr:hypothetical protein [Pseudonocardia endophytica]TCK26160.1 hypothetical protein EV378_1989 [Pseudonocardia endophytica]